MGLGKLSGHPLPKLQRHGCDHLLPSAGYCSPCTGTASPGQPDMSGHLHPSVAQLPLEAAEPHCTQQHPSLPAAGVGGAASPWEGGSGTQTCL